jgi:hypothetical protein
MFGLAIDVEFVSTEDGWGGFTIAKPPLLYHLGSDHRREAHDLHIWNHISETFGTLCDFAADPACLQTCCRLFYMMS